MTDKQEEALIKLKDKYGERYEYSKETILFDTIEEIQKILDFAFYLKGYNNTPQLILDEDVSEEENTKTKPYKQPLLFISLNKRAYAPMDSNSKKLFTHAEELLASVPTVYKRYEYYDEITKQKIPFKSLIFRSDNEFTLTLKTKTVKEQLEIINILEKSLNVYSRLFHSEFINHLGISKIEKKERKDKNELKVAVIYFQVRLNEVIAFNDTYLLEAFRIFSGREDIFEIDGSGDNFTPTNNFKFFLDKSKNEKV